MVVIRFDSNRKVWKRVPPIGLQQMPGCNAGGVLEIGSELQPLYGGMVSLHVNHHIVPC